MATPYVTGPANFWLILPGRSSAGVYLGTAERTPRIAVRPAWTPVFNTLTGVTVPLDYCYDGEEGFVIADITRWNESTYAQLQARPRHSANTSLRGQNITGDIGTLMITEGVAYPLLVQFPYAAKPAYQAAGMPKGYHFYASWLEGPDELDNLGPMARKNRLVWHCGRVTVPNGYGLNAVLYDHDGFDSLPAID